MDLETPESYAASKYKSKYALTYGQKRLNTGYNFNSDTIHLYDGNIYQGAVTMIDSDKYFRSFIGKNGREVPAFMVDNITYTLYNGEEATDLSLYGANYIDTTRTRD